MLKFGNTYLNFGGTYLNDWSAMIKPNFNEVQIGNQIWTSENLNINDGSSGIATTRVTANGIDYGNQNFYTYPAAKRVADRIYGWHLPTKDEWNTLFNTVGGWEYAAKQLKSSAGWANGNGVDAYGFNLKPLGYMTGSTLYAEGIYTSLWTNYYYTGQWGTWYEQYIFNSADNPKLTEYTNPNFYLFQVRLVKD